MLHLVVRRVAALAALPALLTLAAPARAHGPIVPPRPARNPLPIALPILKTARPILLRTPATPVVRPVAPVIRPAAAAPAAAPAAARPARAAPRSLMIQVLRLTNAERRAAGCEPLTVDHNLIMASLVQSRHMARTRLFSHVWRNGSTFVSRAQSYGYRQPAGENIAWGYPTATMVMDAWMASPGHRRNILNCGARSIGAGVVYAADGTPYYTQVFGWS